jgi:enoyl-[acyl-carrier-protein] reductase (NADH)
MRRTNFILLDGKRLVISGVLTEDSIAFAIARQALEHGADVILTNAPGRPSSITGRIARRLPKARVAWPVYDWMGPTKAALESVTRYLARDLGPLGIRVNTISAGPIRSMAGKSIPGCEVLADNWHERAPLGWDVQDSDAVAGTATYLFSDLSRGVTGSIIHVDGGYHAMGAPAHA